MQRYGAVSYLNARPLVEGLDPLTVDTPAGLTRRFASGLLDVALLPVAAAEAAGLRRIGDLGVSADGPVGSVFLFLRRPVGEVETVFLDPSSRTSRQLALLVLDGLHGRRPRPVDDAAAADAQLVIGDPALRRAEGPDARLDLAAEWKRWTGLPFVFAAWYGRSDLGDSEAIAITSALEAAHTRGLAMLDRYVDEAHREMGVPRARLASYLRERIRYRVGEAEQRGLARFVASARAAGLFEDEVGPPSLR